MHSLLEEYLAQVTAHLSPLPTTRRSEELREMQAHLENAVIVNREQGQSEDEATQNAIAQFGAPEAVGQGMVIAWRRGEQIQNRRSFWGAAVSTLAVRFLVPLSLAPLEAVYLHPITAAHLPPADWVLLSFNLCYSLVIPLLAGAMGGFFFPKRVIAGTALGSVLYYVLCMTLVILWMDYLGHDLPGVSVSKAALHLALQSIESGLIALLGAWATSRWRKAWMGRARMARG